MTDNLIYSMREVAHLYAATKRDDPEVRIFTRFDDGLDIPPSTYVEVIVRLVHDDKEVTPILDMALDFAPT